MPVPSSLTLPKGGGSGGDDKTLETSQQTSPSSSPSSRPNSPSSSSPADNNHSCNNKLFVGALDTSTTVETLKTYFEQYGEILECSIMKDGEKRSRGFGFITFKDSESVQKILCQHQAEPIVIDDKTIDPKLAVPRKNNRTAVFNNYHHSQVRRIFVGGLSSDTDEEDIKTFFTTFGIVVEVQLMYDKHTNRHRGFAFVTFEKNGPAEKVCALQFHDLKNKRVEAKVAQPKEVLLAQQQKSDKYVVPGQGGYCPSSAPPFNYSPTFPHFFSPTFHQMAFFGGYGYQGDQHLPSPPFYSPGYNGMPPPFMMRAGHHPDHSLGSPDYLSDHFQSMAIMSNPYISPTGSPPHGFPHFINGVGGAEGSYSPPTGVSPKDRSSPINGYTQVSSSYQPSSHSSSYNSPSKHQQQPTSSSSSSLVPPVVVSAN